MTHSSLPTQKPGSTDKQSKVKLPYFDLLLNGLERGAQSMEASFGRHVHWGYWEAPSLATLSVTDFANAAENLSRQVCSAGAIVDNQSVLDVGCGFGGTIAYLNENFREMELTGLNLDERQLRRAVSQVRPASGNRISFIQGNACDLPFADASFDVVLAVECIFHFPGRKLFFDEVCRVLKPGGKLAISDFISSSALLPMVFLRMNLPERFSVGFYGRCDLQFTGSMYQELAAQACLNSLVARDITRHTLPTYSYLKQLARANKLTSFSAAVETSMAEWASRLGLLRYFIFSWQKPG